MADRYGAPLLALTTLRPADTGRGTGVVHLTLDLPDILAAQVRASELGQRPRLPGHEAAQLLWTLPVGTHLDGRLEAWRDIPGIADLEAGLVKLEATEHANWPASQSLLRTDVATAAKHASWAALSRLLRRTQVATSLNDLLLLFKYAAIHRTRPIARVAALYRLVQALLKNPGPKDLAELVAWMSAPLVVPSVFTESSGRRGPSPPAPPPAPPELKPPLIDVRAPRTAAALALIEAELDARERADQTSRLRRALRSAGVMAADVVDQVVEELEPHAGEFSEGTTGIAPHVLASRSGAATSRGVTRTFLFGSPVLIDTTQVTARLREQRRRLAAALAQSLPDRIRNRLTQLGVTLDELVHWSDLLPLVQPTPSYLEPAGRSDLLLVRQQTTGYRRAEIAYIENILIGEERNRQHVDRALTRTEFFESVERESEETRDLQSTDRAELSREVSKVVSEDLHLEGSVQVSSRGPTKIVASASVAMDRSTEDAASTAESYSRETIERAVKRTIERFTRETRSLFEREITETNSHGFRLPSSESDHVAGVYQFLERVSHAKIFWYGERELYDVIIPEPAALIWQLAITRPELQIPVEEPDHELFETLTFANIGAKLEDVIRSFRVTDIPPQLEPTRGATFPFYSTGGGNAAHYATGKDIRIPDGYVVTDATFVVTAESDEDDPPNGGVTVGGDVEIWSIAFGGTGAVSGQGQTSHTFTFPNPLPGPTVAVAFNADNFTTIAGSVTLNLRLLDSVQQDWAAMAFGRVAERYEQLRREYAQAVIEANANQMGETITLPAGARSALQQVVRAEIQRSVVDVMRNSPVDYDMIASYPYANPEGAYPTVDYARRASEVPEVQFLQQAFEWEHAAWILYPYFWGRRSEWGRMVVAGHPDPDFLAFLNAGAARVQVPVRPGFEDLVKHYMETREVYSGGLPKIGDPGYVKFIDEQLTSLGAPGDEVAWPPDKVREWDIVAPTSLVMVRSTSMNALPTWNPDTGVET